MNSFGSSGHLARRTLAHRKARIQSSRLPRSPGGTLSLPPECPHRRSTPLRQDLQNANTARESMAPPDFTCEAFLGAVERTHATFTLLTPTLLIRIIRSGRLADFDISSLRRLAYGSAPMDPAWIRRTAEAFPGVELVHCYGLTETSPILTTLGWNQHLAGLEGRRPPALGGPPRHWGRASHRRRRGEPPARRGRGGDRGTRSQRIRRLPRPAGGDGGGLSRRVVAHGGRGAAGPGGLPVPAGSQEGHHHHRRGERLVRRSRGGTLRAPRRDRSGCHRGARRNLGRSGSRGDRSRTRIEPGLRRRTA